MADQKEEEFHVRDFQITSNTFSWPQILAGFVIGGGFGMIFSMLKQSIVIDTSGVVSLSPPAPCVQRLNQALAKLLIEFQRAYFNAVSKENRAQYVKLVKNAICKIEYAHATLEALLQKELVVFKDFSKVDKCCTLGLQYLDRAIQLVEVTQQQPAKKSRDLIEGHLATALNNIHMMIQQ